MKLQEILAISGTPGLHCYVAQGRAGIIVESLSDKKRTMVPGTVKVSALGEIAVFTQTEEMPLGDVFASIYKAHKGPVAINSKSSDQELQKFITDVLPTYDTDRVHMSDVKKIALWYNILVNAGMTDFSLEDEQPATEAKPKAAKVAKDEKTIDAEGVTPAKKSPASKAASAVKAAAAPKVSPKAAGAKVKATKSNNIRKSQ